MGDKQGTQKQPTNQEKNTEETTGQKPWRPTDTQEKLSGVTENPTGGADKSPSSEKETGDPGRTPGKAEGEDF